MLRNYQIEIVEKSIKELNENKNVLIQLDTGAGKTLILAEIAKKYENVLIVAHRNLLVAQLSNEFFKENIQHSVIASKQVLKKTKNNCNHCNKYVCSIDTLISYSKNGKLKLDINKKWLIIIDEAHHVTQNNKFNLSKIFKNCQITPGIFPMAIKKPSYLEGFCC